MFLKKKNITLDNKVEAVTLQVAKLQKTIEDQIESMVGIDKWFNTDNQHKNQEIVKTGGTNFRKTWLLMDSNNIVYIDDYPLLFEVLQAEDRGDGTFAMPDFYDGTLRHIRYGDARELGSFEDDAVQSHVHSNTHGHTSNPHNHTSNPHSHDMGNILNYHPGGNTLAGVGYYELINRRTDNQTVTINNATTTVNNTTITTDTGTGKQATETRMKNTAGQWYILAKVTYIN